MAESAVVFDLDYDLIAEIAFDEWWQTQSSELRKVVQATTPVDLGGLKGSVNVKRTGPKTGELYADASYAVVVHEGHGVILPRKPGGVLSWLDKLTGDRVFAKRVGPVAANPYLVRGAQRFGLRVTSLG